MSLKKLHEFSKGKIYLKEICAVAVGDAISQVFLNTLML